MRQFFDCKRSDSKVALDSVKLRYCDDDIRIQGVNRFHVAIHSQIVDKTPATVFIEHAHKESKVATAAAGRDFKNFGLSHRSNSFENSCGAHAATDAHRDHAIAAVTPLELAQNAGSQLGSRTTQGMTQSDRAAIDVNLVRIKTECFDHS